MWNDEKENKHTTYGNDEAIHSFIRSLEHKEKLIFNRKKQEIQRISTMDGKKW